MSNKTIFDYRSEAQQGTIKLIDSKGNAKIYAGTKPIILNNQWKPIQKGALILIENKPYRILNLTANNIAEVFAMYEYQEITDDMIGDSNTYDASTQDSLCNEQFYNSLSSQTKNAIVEKTFSQDAWVSKTNAQTGAIASYVSTWKNPITLVNSKETQSLMNAEYKSAITRNCYLISIQDIINYFKVTTTMDETNTTFTADNINSKFFGSFIPHDSAKHKILFRSAYSGNTSDYQVLSPLTGRVSTTSFNVKSYIRPAFQVDLSKISFRSI